MLHDFGAPCPVLGLLNVFGSIALTECTSSAGASRDRQAAPREIDAILKVLGPVRDNIIALEKKATYLEYLAFHSNLHVPPVLAASVE